MEKQNWLKEKVEQKIKPETILFFDMDGTIIDTDYANYLAYKKAIETVISSNINIAYNPNERFNRGLLKKAIPDLSENLYEKIIQQKEKFYDELLPQTKIIDFVVDILVDYSKTHKTVLVTNCRKERALMTLKYHDLTSKFSKFYFREFSVVDERINKFKNAITDLGVIPEKVLVFENENAEIEDAVFAGIPIHNILNSNEIA